MQSNQELIPPGARPVAIREQFTIPNIGDGGEDIGSQGIVAYWRMIVRHRWTVVFAALLGVIVAVIVTLPQTPIYQAKASVEVQGLNENFLDFKDLNPTSAPGGYIDPSYEILTEVKILESRSLMQQVVDRMRKSQNNGLVARGDRMAAWRKLLHLGPKQELNLDAAIMAAAGGVQIKASGTTRIIDITTDSPDPQIAADFTNTMVDEFVQKNLDDRWKTTERTSQWLSGQLDDLKIKLEKSEDALQSYATAVGLQFTGGDKGKDGDQENIAETSLRQVQEELLKARAERMSTQSKYELITTSPQGALPEVLDDNSLNQDQEKLTDLRRQLAELSTSLTAANPKVEKVRAQIAELESAMDTERNNIVMRVRNDYKATSQREKLLSDEFERQLATVSDQSGKEIHYNILKREVETNRQLYESMLEKVKEAGVASAMKASNFRVVDAAVAPGGPYKPNLKNNALLGLVAGLFLGVVFVLLREQADRSIQQPGDSSLFLGIAELGVIPSDRPMLMRRGPAPASLILRDGEQEEHIELITWQRQRSLVAECFRTVLTSILFSENGGRPPQVFVVASPNPAEGKTTVASNLAIALAEINQRVLLVDADMRRPRLHKLFEVKNDVGFSELLRDKASLDSAKLLAATRETWIPNLHVLTSGPRTANVATLLYSARLPELMQAIRQNFDAVIIDTPPMLHISDARLLARHADAVLLVMRAGKTTRTAAQAARQKFAADAANIMGTILTDWNPDANGYGYDYKYYSTHAAYYMNPALTEGGNGASNGTSNGTPKNGTPKDGAPMHR